METELLEAIIGIRTDMLLRFMSNIVYKQTTSSSIADAMQLLYYNDPS